MSDTKDTQQPRTYKVTRQQMKEIWEAIDPEYKAYFTEVMERQFGHFDNDGCLYQGHIESLCEAAPKELLQKLFPSYFFIPEGEPVLVRDTDNEDWRVYVSDGQGGVYFGSFLLGDSVQFRQIIPFSKNYSK